MGSRTPRLELASTKWPPSLVKGEMGGDRGARGEDGLVIMAVGAGSGPSGPLWKTSSSGSSGGDIKLLMSHGFLDSVDKAMMGEEIAVVLYKRAK